VWCVKKPGREHRDKVELALAWKRVQGEVEQGTLGGDFDRTERAEVLSLSLYLTVILCVSSARSHQKYGTVWGQGCCPNSAWGTTCG
jgi:hypothetical protein